MPVARPLRSRYQLDVAYLTGCREADENLTAEYPTDPITDRQAQRWFETSVLEAYVGSRHHTEPFPSWLCFAELQYVGGLG